MFVCFCSVNDDTKVKKQINFYQNAKLSRGDESDWIFPDLARNEDSALSLVTKSIREALADCPDKPVSGCSQVKVRFDHRNMEATLDEGQSLIPVLLERIMLGARLLN